MTGDRGDQDPTQFRSPSDAVGEMGHPGGVDDGDELESHGAYLEPVEETHSSAEYDWDQADGQLVHQAGT